MRPNLPDGATSDASPSRPPDPRLPSSADDSGMAIPEELPEPPEQDEGPDLWAAALPGQVTIPAYLVSRYAAQYRVIVDVLLDAMDTSLTGMSFDDVVHAVSARVRGLAGADTAERLLADPNFALEARLDRLAAWGVVTRWQEPARTGEDFLRRRDRYQLTPLAARLHAFWVEAGSAEDEAADLTLAPRAVHDRLAAFVAAVDEERYPDAAGEFQQVIAVHQAMARAARSWQRTLAHDLSGPPDETKQERVGRTLHSYIAMWGEQVDTYSPRIAELLARSLPENVWRACARGSLAEQASEEAVDAQAVRWGQTWQALRTWFRGPDAQARKLRRQLRDVISPWARNTHVLMEAGGAVTRRFELLELATAIERAPDDTAAWRLWDTALGAFAARHLLTAADSPEDDDQSWVTAPRAPVPARYREQGPRAVVGRRPRRSDFTSGRQAARQARARHAAERAAAEAALRERSGTHLSEWPELNGAELDLLLELIEVARRGGSDHEATTENGKWRVRLRPPSTPADVATLTCPDGRLVTVDWRFDLWPVA